MRLYLEACAEEDPGDGSLIRAALSDIARAGNMSRLAREIGMSREGLYEGVVGGRQSDVRHGDANHASVGIAVADYGNAVSADAPASIGTRPPARTHRRSRG